MKFHLHRSKAGFWATIVARNGQVLWQTEVYTRRAVPMARIQAASDAGLKLPLVDHTKR